MSAINPAVTVDELIMVIVSLISMVMIFLFESLDSTTAPHRRSCERLTLSLTCLAFKFWFDTTMNSYVRTCPCGNFFTAWDSTEPPGTLLIFHNEQGQGTKCKAKEVTITTFTYFQMHIIPRFWDLSLLYPPMKLQ